MKTNKLTLAALAGVPLVMVLGNSLLIPVLPSIQNALNLTAVEVSLVITLFSIPAGLVIPLAGFLSDRYGRKIVIIPSLILYALGGVVAGLAAIFLKESAFYLILGGRVLQGIGAAGTAPIAMALCGDLWQGTERAKSLGIIEAANGMGKVISPVLGAAIGLIFWYAAFIFFPLVIIPVVLAMWFFVKEPEKQKEPPGLKSYLNSIKNIFKEKAPLLLSCFLAGASALSLIFGVLFFLSDYLERSLHLTGIIKGLALAVPVLFMSTTSYITGALIKKQVVLMKTLVVSGLVLIAISLAVLSFFDNIYIFYVSISMAGVGTGLVLPCLNMLITSATSSEERGMVTSLYNGVRFIGVALGPPAFGLLMGYGRPVMFWAAAGLAGVSAGISFFFIKIRAIKSSSQKEEQGEKEKDSEKRHKPSTEACEISGGGMLVYLSPKGDTTIIAQQPAKKPLDNYLEGQEVKNGEGNNQ
ncbi:MFS transporter [Desulfofalx alkaliphila]|uniref:MFS transporter n=1 Tax=Desulfofalx alkaliphila TaxID=105483 RepID=UPI0004E219E6|nr:MFS transporter [Desulfofalx alkaliphila]